MATLTYENRRSGCYLGESAAANIINEEIIIESGQGVLYPGTVLGLETASGKYHAFDQDAADGTEDAAAILFHKVDATSADVTTVATVRGPATINANMLTWPGDIDAAEQTAAETQLRAKGLAILPQHAG